MMIFNRVSFLKSVSLGMEEVYFDDKKEIIFVGRSNMGKSTLMNTIFEKKDLVKTSAKPGKTRLVNIFSVNNKYYFTDLPGYGFAKMGKELKEDLDSLISWYLEERKNFIKKVIILVDSRIGPQESDIDMYKYLLELELDLLVVLSKVDKISKTELNKSLDYAKKIFYGQEIIPVSSTKKIGIKELISSIKKSLL